MQEVFDFYLGKQTYEYNNPPLGYSYNALEPYIDEETMHLHHDKHLQTYINNLNSLIGGIPPLQNVPISRILSNGNALPSSYRTPILNNAGGVYNHIFFFEGLSPNGNISQNDTTTTPNAVIRTPSGSPSIPTELIASRLTNDFGSFENFKHEFSKNALSVFGSGYTWLVLTNDCRLKIINTQNQDTPLSKRLCPLLNLDVWEHAYYLKYHNVRADYINAFFNIINWQLVESRLLYCKLCSRCCFCHRAAGSMLCPQ